MGMQMPSQRKKRDKTSDEREETKSTDQSIDKKSILLSVRPPDDEGHICVCNEHSF